MTDDRGPIASWDLAGDGQDSSGQGFHAEVRGEVAFGATRHPRTGRPVASLAGTGRLEVALPPSFLPGDLTIAARVRLPDGPRTVIGDVVSWFDRRDRQGFTLGFEHGAPCGSHGNDRMPWFGADTATSPTTRDLGRPGSATIMVCSLAAFEGALYAATWEGGSDPLGHVYRLDAGAWRDCGSPWDANAVTRLAVHDGTLYAGVSRLRGGGSGLEDSANQSPGGRILRYRGGTSWEDLGQLPGADSVAALVPFGADLYAAPMYSEGVYRLAADGSWADCGSPGRRLLALGVHRGALYGAGNDHARVDDAIAKTKAGVVVAARSADGGGGVFRYDGGTDWTSCGLQPDTTQLYSIETYGDRLHIGTWPTGLVFRGEDGAAGGTPRWTSTGRLGDETEVMNLQAYNGMLYGGSLPHAQIYRCDGDEAWALLATLDRTPDVRYRRAASMVLFDGDLTVGTLPSGHVHALRAGAVATADRSLGGGWHELVGVREGSDVRLYVEGTLVATRRHTELRGPLGTAGPLTIGGGPRAAFEGDLADIRLWDRALDADEIPALSD